MLNKEITPLRWTDPDLVKKTSMIFSIDEFNDIFISISHMHGKTISNYYENNEWAMEQIAQNNISLVDLGSITFLICKHDCFYKLYYFTKDLEFLKLGLERIKNFESGVLTCEIIDKYGSSSQALDIFKASDYLEYARLLRFHKRISAKDLSPNASDVITYARQSDASSIINLQHKIFNKYVDRFLVNEDIPAMIEQQRILIAQVKGVFCGFLLFDKKMERAHLQYIVIDKSCGIKGLGNMLLSTLYNLIGEGKLLEVWSRLDNVVATQLYKRKGFVEDGLSDIVLYKNSYSHIIEPLLPLN